MEFGSISQRAMNSIPNFWTICSLTVCLFFDFTQQQSVADPTFCPVTSPFGDDVYIADEPSAVVFGTTTSGCASQCVFYRGSPNCRCFNYDVNAANCSLFLFEPTSFAIDKTGTISAYQFNNNPLNELFKAVEADQCGLPYEYNNQLYSDCRYNRLTTSCRNQIQFACVLPDGKPAFCIHKNVYTTAVTASAPHPMTSSKDCSYPFTYDGVLYHSCMQNVSEATNANYQFACIVNQSLFTCYPPAETKVDYTVVKLNMTDQNGRIQQMPPLMSIADWLIILSRISADFTTDQGWDVYKNGIINNQSDFWIGLQNIYLLTNGAENGGKIYKLRFELQSATNQLWFSEEYEYFYIDDETNSYAIHIPTSGIGDAGDGLNAPDDQPSVHNINGHVFTAKDRANGNTCCTQGKGGWWYNDCSSGRLLGQHTSNFDGFRWPQLSINRRVSDTNGSLKAARMMVKPIN